MDKFYIGLDLGQSQDFTALCVTEKIKNSKASDYHVRHLDRFQLGTTYPTIVDRVSDLISSPRLEKDVKLVVDSTGVGRPVVDLLRSVGLKPIAVNITGGNVVTYEHGFCNVPKRDLISNLLVLLQSGRLKFAEGIPQVQTLIDELLAYQVKISTDGKDSYGNDWRQNPHDDMVLALALACWYGERKKVVKFYHGLIQ
jgi:hypothetical protein